MAVATSQLRATTCDLNDKSGTLGNKEDEQPSPLGLRTVGIAIAIARVMATAEAGDLFPYKSRMAVGTDVIGHHRLSRQAELQSEGLHQLGDG